MAIPWSSSVEAGSRAFSSARRSRTLGRRIVTSVTIRSSSCNGQASVTRVVSVTRSSPMDQRWARRMRRSSSFCEMPSRRHSGREEVPEQFLLLVEPELVVHDPVDGELCPWSSPRWKASGSAILPSRPSMMALASIASPVRLSRMTP